MHDTSRLPGPRVRPPEVPSHKRLLSSAGRRLVEVFQRIRYGSIGRLQVRSGEPVLGGLRWVRKVKVLGENEAHPAIDRDDFPLRREVVEFFNLLDRVCDGVVLNIEVRNGLPFSFEVEESLPD
jgi:hypothetical protein